MHSESSPRGSPPPLPVPTEPQTPTRPASRRARRYASPLDRVVPNSPRGWDRRPAEGARAIRREVGHDPSDSRHSSGGLLELGKHVTQRPARFVEMPPNGPRGDPQHLADLSA